MTRMSFRATDGLKKADVTQLRQMLDESRARLENYREVLSSLDDDDYVARGNGFCDSRYSTDFIESQIEKYEQRVKELEALLNAADSDI